MKKPKNINAEVFELVQDEIFYSHFADIMEYAKARAYFDEATENEENKIINSLAGVLNKIEFEISTAVIQRLYVEGFIITKTQKGDKK